MIHFRLTDRVDRTRARSVLAEPESRLKKTDGHTTLYETPFLNIDFFDANSDITVMTSAIDVVTLL